MLSADRRLLNRESSRSHKTAYSWTLARGFPLKWIFCKIMWRWGWIVMIATLPLIILPSLPNSSCASTFCGIDQLNFSSKSSSLESIFSLWSFASSDQGNPLSTARQCLINCRSLMKPHQCFHDVLPTLVSIPEVCAKLSQRWYMCKDGDIATLVHNLMVGEDQLSLSSHLLSWRSHCK